MSVTEQTWRVWAEIFERVEGHIRRTIRDEADADDAISEIRIMFLEGDCGDGYEPGQALKYCISFLKKQALRQLGLVAVRRTVGRRGAYSAAIKETVFHEDLVKIEDTLRPCIESISYEELVADGRMPEGWSTCIDPLNPNGYDERICEYLESPLVDEAAKRMARMILEGHTQREVAAVLSTSEQTVQRHLARESVKLKSRSTHAPSKTKVPTSTAAPVTPTGECMSRKVKQNLIPKTMISGHVATDGDVNLAILGGKSARDLSRVLATRRMAGAWSLQSSPSAVAA